MTDLEHEVKIASMIDGAPPENGRPVKETQRDASRRNAFLYELMTLVYNLYGFGLLALNALRFKPDMIYERYSLNTFCGILVSKVFRIPLVLEVNAPLAYEQQKYERLAFPRVAAATERWICSNTARTIVVSGVMKDMLCRIGVPSSLMVIVPNGIDPDEFRPDLPCESIRRQWGLEGKIVLGFVGWFKKWHGLENLIEIYSEERWDSENLHLFLVGDGPAREELERIVENYKISQHVTITGSVPREMIPAYISAMDIALQPSATEYASPIKVFEYMGMGKCIVAPDQANIRELIEDGRTGVLFKPGNKEDMANALKRAISAPEYRKSLGRNARQEIFDKGYLWRNNAARAVSLAFPNRDLDESKGNR
jgi:glycosyltransferase involved in cell wall biosynthesis